jgi:hypothetical protein
LEYLLSANNIIRLQNRSTAYKRPNRRSRLFITAKINEAIAEDQDFTTIDFKDASLLKQIYYK